MKIQLTGKVFHEGKMYVAYTPELDLSSCAPTQTKAEKNLIEAVPLFLEEAEKKRSLSSDPARSRICPPRWSWLCHPMCGWSMTVYDLPQFAPMLFMGLRPEIRGRAPTIRGKG
jgi:hypothetical protein